MPGGNRRGPSGQGPMTGRGLGDCGSGQMGRAGQGGQMARGRGSGMGGGWGRGHRNWFHATGLTRWQRVGRGLRGTVDPASHEDEIAELRNRIGIYEQELTEANNRLGEFEAKKDELS